MTSLKNKMLTLKKKLKRNRITRLEFSLQLKKYNHLCKGSCMGVGGGGMKANRKNLYPILKDIGKEAGKVEGHYFLQDIYVANKILSQKCEKHYDIGSRIDGFLSHLLAGEQKIAYMDIRPLPYHINNLEFKEADATNLENIVSKSILSLSSLHAVEHFGLGRYGDEINPNACFEAMRAMQRVLAPNGFLYFSVPIGKKEKCCFNAHRVFLPSTIINCFQELRLLEFSHIKNMKIDTDKECMDTFKWDNVLDEYECGIFIFTRDKLEESKK